MCVFLKYLDRVKSLKLLMMSTISEKAFYAVGRGREIGIYDSWKECKAQTEGFCNAKYRKFYNLEDAQEFVDFWKNYSTPVKESIKTENVVEPEENESICKDEVNNEKLPGVQPTADLEATSMQNSSLSSHHHQTPTHSPHMHFQSQSPCSRLFEERINLKDVDLLALNLRLDSFEKRFDACLKEVGAMSSEISHLRSDLRELKETLRSNSGSRSSPKKGSDGLMQTTLSFGSGSNVSSRSHVGQTDSGEADRKKGRTLKRKLSRSGSNESVKRFADEDILNRLKAEEVDFSSFTLDSDDFVVVYTDGSALSNGSRDARAGIGIWFGDDHPLNVGEPVVGPATSITAEIQAARVAIQLATRAGVRKLKIRTDSEFLINCATKWIHRWKTNGWTLSNGGPVKNKKELEKLDLAASKITVQWEKVPAHSKIKGNETADRLANQGAAKYER